MEAATDHSQHHLLAIERPKVIESNDTEAGASGGVALIACGATAASRL